MARLVCGLAARLGSAGAQLEGRRVMRALQHEDAGYRGVSAPLAATRLAENGAAREIANLRAMRTRRFRVALALRGVAVLLAIAVGILMAIQARGAR